MGVWGLEHWDRGLGTHDFDEGIYLHLTRPSPEFRPQDPVSDDEVEFLQVGGGPPESHGALSRTIPLDRLHHVRRKL